MADLDREQADSLIRAFISLADYDFLLFDTSAGISETVTAFCMASHEVLLVISPEPTSLTDAYALLKVLAGLGFRKKVRIAVNQADRAGAAQKAYATLHRTVTRFLPLTLAPLGVVARDRRVAAAVASQTPFVLMFPDAMASRCVRAMAQRLAGAPGTEPSMPLELFWDRCLNFLHRRKKQAGTTTGSPDPFLVSQGGRPGRAPATDGLPRSRNRGPVQVVLPETVRLPGILQRLSVMERRLEALIRDLRDLRSDFQSAGAPPAEDIPPGGVPVLPSTAPVQDAPPGLVEQTSGEVLLDFETWLKSARNRG
jgi:flagellar biosynthesis protein FlhG